MQASKRNLYFETPEQDSKVVMNLLSGSMDLVDGEMFHFLTRVQEQEEIQPTDENRALLTKCLERGYVYADGEEEGQRLMQLSKTWDESVSRRVESITVYPTFTCNLRCVYCFESQRMKSKADIMSPETLAKMIKAIDAIHRAHGSEDNPMVTIFGGEPLLRRKTQMELMRELLKALSARGFHVGVITNGVELPYYSDMLSEYGVEIVEVTIDGPKKIHDQRRVFPNGRGSFDKVIRGIEAALASRIHTVVRVNVDRQNIEHLPRLADFILERGWIDRGVDLDLYAVDASGKECETGCGMPAPEMLAELFATFDAHKNTRIFTVVHRTVRFFEHVLRYGRLPFPQINFCGATVGNKYSFDLFGKVFPCCCMNCVELEEFNQGEFYPELKLDQKTMELWRKRNVLNLPQCRDCPEALLCGGGCTRIALMCGERLEDGVFCPSIREEFQIALNYYYPALKEKLLSGDQAAVSSSPDPRRST